MQTIERPAIQKAYQHLHALLGDELARHQAFVRERALRDEISEREEAEARGEARGRAEGQADLLVSLLHVKFGDGALPSVEERLRVADLSQLEHWAKRILTAQTLEQVFSDH